jgi:hypothetical protein
MMRCHDVNSTGKLPASDYISVQYTGTGINYRRAIIIRRGGSVDRDLVDLL